MEWRLPNITTEGARDVMLEWLIPRRRSLSRHVAADGGIEYLQAWGHRLDENMSDGDFEIDQFLELWGQSTKAA